MDNITVFVISLVLALALGFFTKVNTGYYALVLAFFNGVFIYGLAIKKVAAMWPIYMFLMLLIVTLFYGFAISNGTLLKVSEKLIYMSRNYPAVLPIVLFLICAIFAGTGAGAPAVFAFLSPLVMAVCIRSDISRLLAVVLILTGACIGSQLPFSMGGIVVHQIAEGVGYVEDAASITMNVWVNTAVTMTLFFIGAYILLKGYKTSKVQIDKPEPFDDAQKKTLCIIGGVMFFIIIPALLKTIFPNIIFIAQIAKFCDVVSVCAVGIVLCLLFKVGNEKEAIRKIPMPIIIMICSMGTLIQVAVSGGLVDSLSEWMSINLNSNFAPYLLILISALLSFFSSTLGVVIPTLALLVPAVVTLSGISPALLFALISVPGMYTGTSPFSTCGAMALAGLEDEKESDKLFKQLLILPIVSAVFMVICYAVGIIRFW